jgi:GH18 family chitinase
MEKRERISLVNEAKNIFIKFLYKSIDSKHFSEEVLKEQIDSTFSPPYLLSNYRKYRLFYTYDDYKKIEEKIQLSRLHQYKEEEKK